MTRPTLLVVVICLVAAGIGLSPSPAAAQKRVALVIGNDSYTNVTPLRKAANDADRMAKTLKGLGFQVISATNQDRRGMSNSLSAFERTLGEGDTAFFFFAGHGFQIKGENYLLPTDVPLALAGEEEKVHENAFLARRIMERIREKGARTTVVVLDACRNNPFERAGTRSVGGAGGLAAMSEEGAFVIYSASENQTALDYASDDDKDPNSVFTRFFAKELGDAWIVAGTGRKAHPGECHRACAQGETQSAPGLLRRDRGRRCAERRARSQQGEGDRPATGRSPSRRSSRSRCRSARTSRSSSMRRSPISCATMAAGR